MDKYEVEGFMVPSNNWSIDFGYALVAQLGW